MYLDTHAHVIVSESIADYSLVTVTIRTLCVVCHSPDEQLLVRLVHSHLLWHVLGQQFMAVINREVRQVLKHDRSWLPETKGL